VHLSVVVVTVVVALVAVENPAYAAVTLASYLGLILLHELGHAAVAHHFGYRVTGIRLAVLHGLCEFQSPERPWEWELCLIAWGGVVAQLAVALPLLAFDFFWNRPLGILGPVVLIFGYYSCAIVIYNLIPAGRRDGVRAWRIVPLLWQQHQARQTVRDLLARGGSRSNRRRRAR